MASDDWWVSEQTFGGMGGPSLEATPSVADIGDHAGFGYMTYAMMWDLDIAAGETITSATLKVTTTTAGGNSSADWYLGTQSGIDTTEPSSASNAATAVNRSGSGWSSAGITPSSDETQYSIDVKDEIVAIIARDDWASGGTITFFLSGPTTPDFESAAAETLAASSSSDKPSLTVVYS